MAELAAKMGLCRPLMDRRAVRDGGLAPAVPAPPAELRLALRKPPRQAGAPARRAVGVAIDGLRADPVLRSVELHPPAICSGDHPMARRSSTWARRRVVRAILEPRSLRAHARRRGVVRPTVGAPVAIDLATDRAPVTTHPPRDLADAQAHLHHAVQTASLLKAEVAVSRSHGDPGHSRCRTSFASLQWVASDLDNFCSVRERAKVSDDRPHLKPWKTKRFFEQATKQRTGWVKRSLRREFQPPDDGTKNRCLTAWRRPKRSFPSSRFRGSQVKWSGRRLQPRARCG